MTAPRRRRFHGAIALLLAAGACTGGPESPPGPPPGAPTIEKMARSLGADVLTALVRGYDPGTSPDVAFVPKPNNVVVRWSGQGLGTDAADPRTTHPTPWGYHQRVPIVLYGPGRIEPGRDRTSVDITAIPRTLAPMIGANFDGGPMLLDREDLSGPPPRAVVVVAYDGGGWNLLAQWPRAWPFLRHIMERGAVFTNATIGSAPSVTSAIHANLGTGVYPETHGMAEITARLPDGSVGDVYFGEEADPRLLKVPTLGDEWDRQADNRSWVGMIGYEPWHLGMMSHGAGLPDADRDVAVLWEDQPGLGRFFVNEELYELPQYLPREEGLRTRLTALDGTDGAIDGSWRGYDLADPRVVPATPAFVEHQGAALLGMLRREPFGEDRLTDLLFVELKPTDFGGHLWNMVAPEEAEVLRAQDRVLRSLVRALDREVGAGRWVLAFTADHGQTLKPETTGGLRVHPDILGRKAEEYFGRAIVQKVTPSGLFLDLELMERAGITLDEVARFVGDFRYGDGLPADVDRSSIPAEQLEERVFAAALPSDYLASLTEEQAAALGPGAYPEGNLTSPVPVPL
jgi:Type I phosphodiesterase / nucleotide pyrophosphatase